MVKIQRALLGLLGAFLGVSLLWGLYASWSASKAQGKVEVLQVQNEGLAGAARASAEALEVQAQGTRASVQGTAKRAEAKAKATQAVQSKIQEAQKQRQEGEQNAIAPSDRSACASACIERLRSIRAAGVEAIGSVRAAE